MENQLTALERKIDELLASVDGQTHPSSVEAEAADTRMSEEQAAKK